MNKTYYKITNAEECHHGFQYKDGLNILEEKFNDNANDHCCAGGLYFSDAEHIFAFLSFGIYLREIMLPIDDPEFKMISDENKYRANKIILGKRYELASVETIKMLVEKGADIHAKDDYALSYSAGNGHLEIVKYLIEKGANIHARYDAPLRYSAQNSHLEVLKYLIESGADIHADDDDALKWSAVKGHFEVVKDLVARGADIHAGCDAALRWCAEDGHLNVVKYLIEKGADIHAKDDYALRYSAGKGHLEVVKYLIEKGANINVIKDDPIMEKLTILVNTVVID